MILGTILILIFGGLSLGFLLYAITLFVCIISLAYIIGKGIIGRIR